MRKSNQFLKIITLTLLLMGAASSCKKDNPEPGPGNSGSDASYFRWQIDQGAITDADSAYARESSFVIFAFQNSGSSIEINLSDMKVGNHEISPAKGNQLTYTDAQASHDATGTLNITESDAEVLSGNFSCHFNNSNLSTITGTFSGIPKR